MKLSRNSNQLNSNQSSCDFQAQAHSFEASSTLEQEVLTSYTVVSDLTLGQVLPFLTSLFSNSALLGVSRRRDKEGRQQTNSFNTFAAWRMEAWGSFKGEVTNPASTEKNFLCRAPFLTVNNLSDGNARKDTDTKAKSAKNLYSESWHMQPCPSCRKSVIISYTPPCPSNLLVYREPWSPSLDSVQGQADTTHHHHFPRVSPGDHGTAIWNYWTR